MGASAASDPGPIDGGVTINADDAPARAIDVREVSEA